MSYLYGRPVKDWSTPPLASDSSSSGGGGARNGQQPDSTLERQPAPAALLHGAGPRREGRGRGRGHTTGVASADGQSSSGRAHDSSWLPLSAVMTPSHAPTASVVQLSRLDTHRYSVPTTSTPYSHSLAPHPPPSHLHRHHSSLPPHIATTAHQPSHTPPSFPLPSPIVHEAPPSSLVDSVPTSQLLRSASARTQVTARPQEGGHTVSDVHRQPQAERRVGTAGSDHEESSCRSSKASVTDAMDEIRARVSSNVALHGLPTRTSSGTALLSSTEVRGQREKVVAGEGGSVSAAPPLPPTQSAHEPDMSPSSLPTKLTEYPIRRAISDRQLYCVPESDFSSLEQNSEAKAVIGRDLMPGMVGSKPPTAKVPPFVGEPPGFYRHDDQKVHPGEKMIPTTGVDAAHVTALHRWNEATEGERMKGVLASLDSLPGSHDRHVTSKEPLPDSSQRWKAVIESKDKLLAQKSQIIDRQKLSLSRLQQQVRESECRLRQWISSQALEDGVHAKLKELEAENLHLRVKYDEELTIKSAELCEVSKKLDACQFQLLRSSEGLKQRSAQSHSETESLRTEVLSRDEKLRNAEDRILGIERENAELKVRLEQLTSYLGDVPAMEYRKELQQQVRRWKDESTSLSSQLDENEKLLCDARQELLHREGLVTEVALLRRESEEQCARLERLLTVEEENERLEGECQRLRKLLFESDSRGRRELAAMRERHRHKFLEATAKLQSQHRALAKRNKALEAQLIRNSDAITAMSGELQLREGVIGDLKSSVKEIATQNQDLVRKNIGLQEATTEAVMVAASVSEARSTASQQLTSELSRCVGDLESLVGLCLTIVEGDEPSPSLLLGVSSEGTGNTSLSEADVDDDVEGQLRQVLRLKGEVERLRTTISDQFAAQVVSSATCHVQ